MTTSVRRLLFATDFSDCAARAQTYAVQWAKAFGAPLDVLYVMELVPGMDIDYPVNRLYLDHLRSEGEKNLKAVLDQVVGAGVKAETHSLLGIASFQISELARERKADLIVMGTHGRTGLDHVLLGSTAERVVRTAPCPVMTVRGARAGGDAAAATDGSVARPRRILLPLDFSGCSLAAAEVAAGLVGQFESAITVLHVMEPVSYGLDFTLIPSEPRESAIARVETRLADLVAALKVDHGKAELRMEGGLPADSILEWAAKLSADLIVMGTHGRRGVSHLMAGSVAEAVLRRAACPVLTVKSPKYRSR